MKQNMEELLDHLIEVDGRLETAHYHLREAKRMLIKIEEK
jgi:hypothetical protein